MVEIIMPKAGMDMQEGTLIRWLKEVGDKVELNEPIMEIETDKITMESESPGSGVLLAKTATDGDVIPVLEVIGYIGEEGEQIPDKKAAVQKDEPTIIEPVQQTSTDTSTNTQVLQNGKDIAATPYAKKLSFEMGINLSDVTPSGKFGEIKAADVISATPLATKVAADLNVDLSGVTGSGHGGKILKDDVLALADNTTQNRVKMSSMRKVISERLTKSHQEIPVVTQHMKVNVTELLLLRAKLNENSEEKISLNDFILKAVARAVSEFSETRTCIQGNELIVKSEVNLGFAVGVEDGLLVPVIKNADLLSLSNLSKTAKDLATAARTGNLRQENMTGGTFTVSNLGMFNVYAFTPIINPPESGILGVCSVEDELALINDKIVVNKIMMISFTYDHRIMDGVVAAKFQQRIKGLLENPLIALT